MSLASVRRTRLGPRLVRVPSKLGRSVLPLFVGLSFLSAGLLFSVQPMVARMILPRLGGSAAVWTTCMLFFQAALLLGYAYAHESTKRMGTRLQARLHAVLIVVPLAFLPFALNGDGGTLRMGSDPTLGLLGLLLATAGPPFLAVATSAPLLQRWLASSRDEGASDPYFLYAAGNLGSMMALLAYPLLIEPRLGLATQNRVWMACYVLWMVLTWCLARRTSEQPNTSAESAPAAPVALGPWLRWVGLAFVPSSLLLGVTTYLSTDIASIPLLWVVPLALYLLTFILAFASRPLMPHAWVLRATPVAIVLLVLVLNIGPILRPELVPVHLGAFFLVAWACHGELARSRPDAARLTSFYLALSVGGVLGGVFNALIAPVVFSDITEYPLMIGLAGLSLPAVRSRTGTWRREVFRAVSLGLAVVGAVALLPSWCKGEAGSVPLRVVLGAGALLMFTQKDRPVRFALVTLLVLAAGALAHQDGRVIERARSFYGVSTVTRDADGQFHRLRHGSTLHGTQARGPGRERSPLSYYHETGPGGQFLAMLDAETRTPRRVALVGLGTGALTAYAHPEQSWTLFEIDPEVARIALDPRDFTYLKDCPARSMAIHLGDGRIGLAAASDDSFDLIIIDAFSSDAIPVHLLTREALSIYLKKLTARGTVLINISNRYFDLAPVVGALARDAGLVARVRMDVTLTREEAREGKSASAFAVLARTVADLGPIATDRRWFDPAPDREASVWTDDHADLLRHWKR